MDLARPFGGRGLGITLGALIAFGLGGRVALAGNTCTWTNANATGTFSDPLNWVNCGGAYPGQVTPGADAVVFDGTSPHNVSCSVNVAIDVNSISFQNSYTATVSPSGATAMRIRGNLTMTSGANSKLTLTSATTQIGGTFNETNGTLDPNGGTVVFNSTSAVSHTFLDSFKKVIINDGLVGYWNLDGSLADGSGYGNTGTLHGTTSFTAVVPATIGFSDADGVAFDGLTGYAQVAAPVNMPAADVKQTISLWAKFSSSLATQSMVALTGAGSAVKFGLGGNNIRVWKTSGADLAHVAAPIDGAWHHIAYVYDPLAGTTDKLYVDGVLTNGLGVGHDAGAVTGVFIGSDSSSTNFFNGSLDDVRIYSYALSATQVSGLAFGGMPAASQATHTFSKAFTATGDFVIASGAVTGTKALTVGGSWLNYGGVFTGTGLVKLGAVGGSILSGGQLMGGGLTITGGTYTLADRLWAQNQTLTVSSGATLTDGTYVVHAGAMAGTGTFNYGTGTVVLDFVSATPLGASTFYNLRIEDPTEANLVAYWKLDEGNGATVHDSSVVANTGSLTGGATWTTGASSSIGFDDAAGLSFDGSGYGSMPLVGSGTNKPPAANESQTISFWAKFPSTSGIHDMVTLIDAADASGLEIGINGGNLNVWEYGSPGPGPILISMVAPSINTWHHIAYVYDSSGAGTDQLYVDGVVHTGGGNTTTHQTGRPTIAYLGTWDAGSELYNGQLDDVRIYKAALTAAQVAQLAVGRYAGTGGYGTISLGASTSVHGFLRLDAGNLTANGNTLTATLASSITTGTYTVDAAQTFSSTLTVLPNGGVAVNSGGSITSGDLTVQSPATLTVTSGTVSPANLTVQSGASLTLTGGTVAIGSGKIFTMDGTLAASSGAIIKSTAGYYTFEIGSTLTATPTLNITGLAVQNTDTNGMWINAVAGATTTFTRFDNIAFSSSKIGTNALLQIYAPTLYLTSNGCTFDGSATYAIKLVGNNAGDVRAVFGDATCATNTNGICATSEKSDDDANNDGIADMSGGANNGSVVQFVRSAAYAGGTFQGFPTAAFDWNTFSYYSTYAVFRNDAGTADTLSVEDETGAQQYSWPTGAGENIIGTPQWTTVAGKHYVYVATNNGNNAGKIYRLIDTLPVGMTPGSLAKDATWGAANPYLCTCTVKSQLSLDANNIYWAATSVPVATTIQQLWEIGQGTGLTTAQSKMTGWPLTTPAAVTTSSPALVTSGGTTLYLAITGDLLQLDVTGTTFNTNSNPGTVKGRVSIGGTSATGGTRVYAGDSTNNGNSGTMWAIDSKNFGVPATSFIWSYSAGSAINGSSYYDNTTDTIQFGTQGGAIIVLNAATGAAKTGYPYPLPGGDPITSAPLYYNGILAVGTTLGKLFFLDRDTGSAPNIRHEYNFGPTESVSAIGFDANVNRFMVSTSSAAKDARLYYFDLSAI
jgi:Concanavalin A-like lectin/glucanases superfamily